MIDVFISIGGIYLFILLGFIGKKYFKEKIDEKSIVLISIYLLQPMLVFWGLTSRPIDSTIKEAPVLFLIAIFILLVISLILATLYFDDKKSRSIAIVGSIVGNTGNLGIPLGIALFGEESIIYTSIINLVNVFIVYTIGVYFYSRGNFSIVESIKNIFKLPAIWFGVFAILFNLFGFNLPHSLLLPLKMGAYATMVLQLMIFGIYLATVKISNIDKRLVTFTIIFKFIITPIIAIVLLYTINSVPIVYNVVILELLVPLAVMNVNLAALYDCKPEQVAFLTFATSFIFLVYLFMMVKWIFLV